MKFFLLAALVGFCSAIVLPTGRRILFDQDVAHVHGLTGNQYMFKQYPGQKFIDVVLNGPNTPMKKIQIDGETCHVVNMEGFPRMDKTLVHSSKYMVPSTIQPGYFMNVLKQYQGTVDEYQFKHLLEKMDDEVKEGRVCHIIYHLLTLLDEIVNEDLIEKYFVEKQFGGVFHPQQYQQILGSFPRYGYQQPWACHEPWCYQQQQQACQGPWCYQQQQRDCQGPWCYQQQQQRDCQGPWCYQQQWGYNTRFGGVQTNLKNYLLGKVNPMGYYMTPYKTATGYPTMSTYGYQNPMMMRNMMINKPYYY